jgi:uncharacterized YigZ family protein
MTTKFSTVSGEAEGLFKDRGSKFFAYAFPVISENEVKEKLEQLRKQFHDARHHCYAWKIGVDPGIARANDDGEPSSSAGKPILNQIEKMNLTNILVVVIRYFGGTLLGVGGLINAYRSATEDCLHSSKIVVQHIQLIYSLEFEYPLMNEVMKVVKEYELESFDQVFELSCALKLKVNLELKESVVKKLKNIKGCRIDELSSE